MNFTRDEYNHAVLVADQAAAEADVAKKNAERLRNRANEIAQQYERHDPDMKSKREEIVEILHMIDEGLRDPNPQVVESRKNTMTSLISGWGNREFKDTTAAMLRAKKGSIEERRRYELFVTYIRGFAKNSK